ncbi:MmcQ/YjbR family DNA-binding protein [Candidatus Saccharibacteria bacterium]|nr:MmcQ/YjbR family DNA-binding protein [Candidatus Saccharibacteria bacterium]
MVSEEAVVEHLAQFADVSERSEKGWRIFSRGEKIFLCVEEGKTPLRIELRCDRKLGQTLQERYESVMESRALGRNGIEVVCTGQLSDDEIFDLVRHAYEVSAPEESEE